MSQATGANPTAMVTFGSPASRQASSSCRRPRAQQARRHRCSRSRARRTTSKELRLVLAPLARVKGRVVMNGSPVEGAQVAGSSSWRRARCSSVVTSATSQADGTFTLDGVPFGTTRILGESFLGDHAEDARHQTTRYMDGVVLEVSKLATLRGHVLRKGKPVAGAEVQYMPLTPQSVAATSNADGTYVLEGLPPGDGSIGAISVKSKAWSPPRPVHLAAGEERTEDVVLDLAGEVLGTVVDEAGKPVSGVYVRMDTPGDHCEAITGNAGDFDCAVARRRRVRRRAWRRRRARDKGSRPLPATSSRRSPCRKTASSLA